MGLRLYFGRGARRHPHLHREAVLQISKPWDVRLRRRACPGAWQCLGSGGNKRGSWINPIGSLLGERWTAHNKFGMSRQGGRASTRRTIVARQHMAAIVCRILLGIDIKMITQSPISCYSGLFLGKATTAVYIIFKNTNTSFAITSIRKFGGSSIQTHGRVSSTLLAKICVAILAFLG
jgi:hypothetical protein